MAECLQYINGAIIDATINNDILSDSPIGKPALLRQTFELGASYSGEIVSLTKMIGSLQDAVYNNALKTVYSDLTYKEAILNRKEGGQIFESAVGAHIISNAFTGDYDVFYWREKDKEVDYILKKKSNIVAIEVKSNSETYNAGLKEIRKIYHPYATMVVGEGGMKVEDFLSINPAKLF